MDQSSQSAEIQTSAEREAALFSDLLLDANQISQSVLTGLHGRKKAGSGETYWQHRPYTVGDEVSAIDWRQSARTADRLFIRQNEWEAAASAHLWCDNSPSMDFSSSPDAPTKLHRSYVLATALSVLLSNAGERIAVIGDHARPSHGRSAPARILERLLAAPTAEGPIATHNRLVAGTSAVLISDFYGVQDNVKSIINEFSSVGVTGVLVQICDPVEEDFPFTGRTEFQDLESSKKLVFGQASTLKNRYQSAFKAHCEKLKQIAQTAGWTHIFHRTDQSAATALKSLFLHLGGQRAI